MGAGTPGTEHAESSKLHSDNGNSNNKQRNLFEAGLPHIKTNPLKSGGKHNVGGALTETLLNANCIYKEAVMKETPMKTVIISWLLCVMVRLSMIPTNLHRAQVLFDPFQCWLYDTHEYQH